MNWKEIFKTENISEGKKLISKYQFSIPSINSPVITILLWEYFDGSFFATTDYFIQNKYQQTPFRENNIHSSAEEALKYAIQGITTWIREPYDQINFIKENI